MLNFPSKVISDPNSGQKRILFGNFITKGDVSPITGRSGIRTYKPENIFEDLALLFRKYILHNVVTLKDSKGKIRHLNKESLKEWIFQHGISSEIKNQSDYINAINQICAAKLFNKTINLEEPEKKKQTKETVSSGETILDKNDRVPKKKEKILKTPLKDLRTEVKKLLETNSESIDDLQSQLDKLAEASEKMFQHHIAAREKADKRRETIFKRKARTEDAAKKKKIKYDRSSIVFLEANAELDKAINLNKRVIEKIDELKSKIEIKKNESKNQEKI